MINITNIQLEDQKVSKPINLIHLYNKLEKKKSNKKKKRKEKIFKRNNFLKKKSLTCYEKNYLFRVKKFKTIKISIIITSRSIIRKSNKILVIMHMMQLINSLLLLIII